ncbi:MAG TPA: DUF1616 domain-containing protein [Ignisphaera aggregans]|uniref:DUF1616 domain-containing protein n=1 Tax=Ignisphaera aggregans TaxID=334771 RepID=A0A832YXK3_9CREN|nr:DUF1616 domain-containing protein [Ignisphaera aggregans]
MGSTKRITLEEYVERVAKRYRGDRYRALQEVYSRWLRGELKLVDPNPPRDYVHYLSRLDYSLWFWTVMFLVSLTLTSIAFSYAIPVLRYLRYVLGSIFVLYLPGATLIEALYPREEDLSPLERLALSIGLSLAVVPLIGLILNYTPWGIRLVPIVVSLTIFTVIMSIIASWRKYLEVKHGP